MLFYKEYTSYSGWQIIRFFVLMQTETCGLQKRFCAGPDLYTSGSIGRNTCGNYLQHNRKADQGACPSQECGISLFVIGAFELPQFQLFVAWECCLLSLAAE